MLPRWADDKCVLVMILALISIVCGISSCFFLHSEILETWGRVLWFTGLAALLINIYFYLRGLYQKFLDQALDAYY